MRYLSFLLFIGITGFSVIACQGSTTLSEEAIEHDFDTTGLEKAHFASGCFWCVEAIFESVKGVRG